MKKEQGNTALVLVAVIALIVLAFWWLAKSGYQLPQQTATGPEIEDVNDLSAAGKDLDNTNLNQMDSDMNQISSSSSSF